MTVLARRRAALLHAPLAPLLGGPAPGRVDRFDRMAAIPDRYAVTTTTAGTYFDAAGELAETTGPSFPARFTHAYENGVWAPRGLLIEGAGTNSVLHNRALDNAAWPQSSAPTVTSATGIDGAARNISVEDNSPTSSERVMQDVTISDDSAAHCYSVFIPKTTGATVFPSLFTNLLDGSSELAQITLLNTNTGAIATVASFADGTSQAVDDYGDWWRLSSVMTNNSTGNTTFRVQYEPAASTDMVTRSNAAMGTTIFDHGQLDLNSDVALSPVETGASAVTRGADLISRDLSALDMTSFTLVAEWDDSSAPVSTGTVVELNDGATGDYVNVTRKWVTVAAGGVAQALLTVSAATIGRHRLAVRIEADNMAASLDGGAVVTDTNATVPPLDALLPGRSINTPFVSLNGTLRSVELYPSLSDGALVGLSGA